MKPHLKEINIIKAIAALSVIAIHVTGPYVTTLDFAFFCNQIVRYAVPIFIIISGLLLQYSYKNKEFTYKQFLIRRLSKIGIPYIIWTIIYTLYTNRHNLSEIINNFGGYLNVVFKSLLLGNGYDHLYFVVIIVQFYLIYPILRYSIRKSAKLTLIVSLVITLYFQTAFFMFRYSMFYLPKSGLEYYYIMFPTWIFYFVLGMYISGEMENWRNKLLNTNKINLSIIWIISFFVLLTESKVSNTYGSSIKPTVMIYCVISFVFFYGLALQFNERKANTIDMLNWIGEQSFLIYLSHLLIMGLLKSYTSILNFNNLWLGELGMILYFIIVILLSLVFSYIISNTPLAIWVGGVNKIRNSKVNNIT